MSYLPKNKHANFSRSNSTASKNTVTKSPRKEEKKASPKLESKVSLRVHDPNDSMTYLKKVQKLIHVFDQKSPRELNVIDSEDEPPEELFVLEPKQHMT